MSIELVQDGLKLSITPEQVQDAIKCKEFHLFQGTRHMVCCMTLQNGFTVVGESACADPAAFDLILGQKCAAEDAQSKIAVLLAYEQATKLAFGGNYDH